MVIDDADLDLGCTFGTISYHTTSTIRKNKPLIRSLSLALSLSLAGSFSLSCTRARAHTHTHTADTLDKQHVIEGYIKSKLLATLELA
jgi:hypothetical protein